MTSHRLRACFLMIAALLCGLAMRLAYIQIFQSVAYTQLAQRQFSKKVKSECDRGSILDRNGQILATTLESQSVFANPKELKQSGQDLRSVRANLAMSQADWNEKISSRGDFVWLTRKLGPKQAEWFHSHKIKGLGIVSEQKRYYPNGSLACHILGAVGLDNQGLAGVEQGLNSYLTGKEIVLDQIRDGKGRRIPGADVEKSLSPELLGLPSSNSIVLTIDRSLQFLAEREIQRGVEENKAERGMLILQNPKTGEILAMAAYPNFDPNHLSKGRGAASNLQLQNPMVSRTFEPGSTFKLITFAAALEEKKVSLSDTFDCENGKWQFGPVMINDHEPEGLLTLSEVMEKSSNIGTGKVGLKLGKDLMYEYARAFGFGNRTGLPIPGETDGLLRSPKAWSGVSLPIIAFGQGIGVTALQLVNAYSAIANNGVLMEPMLIKEMIEPEDGKLVKKTFDPKVVRQVVSPQTAAALRKILTQVVEKGTGVQAKVEGYSVAGKTGTAQKIDPATKRYSTTQYNASFCGFVPAEDPQLVCLVILEDPRKDYWGGSTAAPIFARVVSRAVHRLGIQTIAKDSIPLTLVRNP